MNPYIVVIPSRGFPDESALYDRTLNSLLNQTVPPRAIFVVHHHAVPPVTKLQEITHLNLPSSIPRDEVSFMAGIPKINLGFEQRRPNEHAVISGDDSEYLPNYFETLLTRVEEDSTIGIISGQKLESGRIEYQSMPLGSGRLYSKELIPKIFPHPYVIYGESLFLLQCQMFGFHNSISLETYFNHMRPSKIGSLRTAGHSAYMLGYPMTYTMVRAMMAIVRDRKTSFSILLGHVEAMLMSYPKADLDVLHFVKKASVQKYRNVIGSLPI